MPLDEEFFSKFNDMVTRVQNINEQISDLQEVKKIVAVSKNQLEDLTKAVSTLKKENTVTNSKIESLESENESLKAKLNDLEQYSRKSNVLIKGVPTCKNENLVEVVLNLANSLGIELSHNDISAIHPLPSRRGRHPHIIMKLINLRKKEEFIRKSKGLKINTSEMGFKVKEPIRVDEHLSQNLSSQNSKILNKALQHKKEGNLCSSRMARRRENPNAQDRDESTDKNSQREAAG